MDCSKKLVYIRIVIVLVVVLLVTFIIIIFINVNNNINQSVNTVDIMETTEKEIVFDMALAPNQQRNLKGHIREYMSQVYDYLYSDKKWKSIKNPYPYDYVKLKQKGDINDFYQILKSTTMPRLINTLFSFDNAKIFDEMYIDYPLSLDDIPVTENYKEKHPEPLFKEFDIKKDAYIASKKFYNEYMDFDYWYEFDYEYSVGVDEENKIVGVGEKKIANLVCKDRETGEESSGIVRDKEGNEVPAYVETRNFYFKYTTDEKGYVDDIVFDRVEVINDDKYLDNLIKYE